MGRVDQLQGADGVGGNKKVTKRKKDVEPKCRAGRVGWQDTLDKEQSLLLLRSILVVIGVAPPPTPSPVQEAEWLSSGDVHTFPLHDHGPADSETPSLDAEATAEATATATHLSSGIASDRATCQLKFEFSFANLLKSST